MGAATGSLADALVALADLATYPEADVAERVGRAAAVLRGAAPAVAAALRPFARHAAESGVSELQELYARTFDWSPTRCLEIGWHLHGENYDRGAFLVRMRDLHRRVGLEEGSDLPDHLHLVLRTLPRLPGDEAATLVSVSLRPALERMRAGFAKEDSPYAALIEAVRVAVDAAFPTAGEATCR